MPSDTPNHSPVLTGFAGLSGLVSNVDDLIASATRRADAARRRAAANAPATDSKESGERGPRVFTAPASTSGNRRWLWRAGAVLFVLWLIAFSSNNSGPGTSAPAAGSARTASPSASSQPSAFEPSSAATEQMPPLGADRVLGAAQIRYCLSEDIRLEAARDAVSVDAEVDRFNAMIEDYNTRCSNYRYRREVFESVQRQVQANRMALQTEGIARFRR